jgi:hypothetical protein
VEALEAQGWMVRTAREFGNDIPIAVTPITLKPRSIPGASEPVKAGSLPPNADPRQLSLFGAAWTAGILKHLAEAGTWSATFYETTGSLGIMETRQGSPDPQQFPSTPDTVFPCYHVFAWLAEYAGADVVPLCSSAPLEADGLGVRKEGRIRLILADFTGEGRNVYLEGFPGVGRILRLNRETHAAVSADPIPWCSGAGEQADLSGDPSIALQPHELVRLDFEEAPA